jgi:hypothetical protein
MAEILVPSRKIRRYGWIPSLPTLGEAVANVGGVEVKDEVDNRDVLSGFAFNQWALGACTANATGNHFRFDATLDGKDPGPLCRLGIYWGERKIEGSLGHGDTGASGHDAFTVAKGGIPRETAWKYEWEGMEQEQPPPGSYFDPSEEPSRYLKAKVADRLTKQVATCSRPRTPSRRSCPTASSSRSAAGARASAARRDGRRAWRRGRQSPTAGPLGSPASRLRLVTPGVSQPRGRQGGRVRSGGGRQVVPRPRAVGGRRRLHSRPTAPADVVEWVCPGGGGGGHFKPSLGGDPPHL